MAFFDFIDLRYQQLSDQVNGYLRDIYSRSNEMFSSASPFGQILNVLKEFYQFIVLYQKNIVRNLDIDSATDIKVVRSLARIAGHNPTRPISATGTIKLALKQRVNLTDDIVNGTILIADKTQMRNKTNGLYYTIRLVKDSEIFKLSSSHNIYLNVIQGKYEEQTLTGNGLKIQSYSINVQNTAEIDNFEVEVLYNGTSLTIRDSLYDMSKNEFACFVRTGISGGIDIYFGNGSHGFIPASGSIITVRYLLTNGTDGNILTPVDNDFVFTTPVYDGGDNILNMDDNFDITIYKDIQFSSNGEQIGYLSSTLPNVSRNFVLATPSQYVYHLSRLEMFSIIDVFNTLTDNNYDNDNKVYLFLVPKISNYYNSTINYFNVPLNVFSLDQTEIDKTLTYLKRLGSITNGTVLQVLQPVISKYIMNVYIRKYEGYSDDSIKLNIISYVSNYLNTLTRGDRIVRSDLISTIEGVSGVDSVNLNFVSEKNERLHKSNPLSNELVGIDPILGDIVLEKVELGLIRGGWSDRNGTYYNESPNGNALGPINIIFIGTTPIKK